jgi:myosin heavy subunit
VCLELIETPHTGLLGLLDEVCLFPKGTEDMFARKVPAYT